MTPYGLSDLTIGHPYKHVVVSRYAKNTLSSIKKKKSESEDDDHKRKTIPKGETKILSAVGTNYKSLASYYKEKAKQAHRNRNIFCMRGFYPTIRRELVLRGYLEKLQPGQYFFLENLAEDVLVQNARNGNDYERILLSKYMKSYPAYFVWHSPADVVPTARPLRNLVRLCGEYDFTSKTGLIACASQTHWHGHLGTLLCPRFFHLCKSFDDRKAFIDNFRITQCQSLLRYVVEKFRDNSARLYDYEKGTIPFFILGFAYHKVRAYIDHKDNSDLDSKNESQLKSNLESSDWRDFIINSYQVLNSKGIFKANLRQIDDFVKKASLLLIKLERIDYTSKWDGYKNLWILKPGKQSRGIGIILRNTLDEILTFASDHLYQKYIVQKYIERPFLVYRTKFDIRQYMLITINDEKLSLWLYKECYFKFSSTEFNLDDFNEQIHLTNNSVQKRYRNKINRDHRLPPSNMWNLLQFKKYLSDHGYNERIWEKKIFSGFKENLIACVMAGIEDIEIVPNSFDLYGCDFMLDESLQPILIEINSTPDMTPSTEVTASLCPKVLKDMIKVVVDLPHNSAAPVGLFEHIFDAKYKTGRLILENSNLTVVGKGVSISKIFQK